MKSGATDRLMPAASGMVVLNGRLGDKIGLCINNRVLKQDVATLVQPFRDHADKDDGWRGEFWGKWFTSAVLAYRYQPTPATREILDRAVEQLVSTQGPGGDINTYDAAHRFGNWDVWTRKYVLLGLLAYYDQTQSPAALDASKKEADTLIRDFGPDRMALPDASLDVLHGLSSSSVLEPVCLLYQRTHEAKYLAFARYIVASWELAARKTPQGMHLIEDALNGVPPFKMVSPKAYEMMSCFEGLCEFYRITGERRYLDACVQFGKKVIATERMIDGSASNQELWCNGAVVQTAVLEQPQETCVTTTWIKLCAQLLRLTGDSSWADEIELSIYNALLSAQTPEGNWWAYFSPLSGQRVPSLPQYLGLSCCVANGPRSLLLIPELAVMTGESGPVLNLYANGTYRVSSGGGELFVIEQQTTYPETGTVRILLQQAPQGEHTISLRIPAWSKVTEARVNGEVFAVQPGGYARVRRAWRQGDVLELKLDMRGRVLTAPGSKDQLAVMRGPVLLAMDNRLIEPQPNDVWLIADEKGYVDLQSAKSKPADVWMAFDATFEVKPSHFYNHHPIKLTLCDFSSAGNEWSEKNLFRTWLPQPLYMADLYPPDTWKLMYPGNTGRPSIPKGASSHTSQRAQSEETAP
jgi:uncharacterized protein